MCNCSLHCFCGFRFVAAGFMAQFLMQWKTTYLFVGSGGVYLIGTIVCFAFSDNMTALEVGRLLALLRRGQCFGCSGVFLGTVMRALNSLRRCLYISISFYHADYCASVWWLIRSSRLAGGVPVCSIVFIGHIYSRLLQLPETLPYGKSRFEVSQVVKNYGRLLTNRQVISSASYNWMSYMASLVSLSLFPFLMQEQLGLTAAEYASLMIVPSAGLLIGSVALNLLNRRFSTPQLMS